MTRARDTANLIGSGNFSSTTFTATAGQTAFTISHTQGFVQVFMNGLLLDETVDYTSNGTAITLTSGAAAGDEIEVVAYNTFSVGDAQTQAAADARYYTQTAADTRYVNTTGDTMTGTLVASTRLQVGDSSITQGYTQANFGYVADFQATTGSQTFISIAPPNVSSLGDNGTVIGEDGSDTYITQRNNKNIKLGTSNVNRLIIDGSGRVTMPYQPAFGARNTSNATEWKGGSSVYVNTGNHYNNTTGIFTAPVAGNYYFFGGGQSAGGGAFYWGFYKNGGQIYEFYNAMSGYTYGHASVAAVVPMAANDTLQFKRAGSVNMNTGGQNHFSGFLIG